MHPTLRKILERDDYLCGVHVGGCGKKIDCEKDEPTIDHIWSKSYLRKHRNKTVFLKPWNYQPMCRECNNQRGGQIVGPPQFRCDCHHTYTRSNGDILCYYKESAHWKSVWVTNVQVVEASEERLVPPIRLTIGRRYEKRGFKIGGFGHLMSGYYPLQRIVTNAQQLFRVGRFQECWVECGEFKKRYEDDGGKSLRGEFGQKAEGVLAEFYFLRIFSGLYASYGGDFMGVFATDFDSKKSMLAQEFAKEILSIDESNFDAIFALLASRCQSHIDYLLDIGRLRKMPNLNRI